MPAAWSSAEMPSGTSRQEIVTVVPFAAGSKVQVWVIVLAWRGSSDWNSTS